MHMTSTHPRSTYLDVHRRGLELLGVPSSAAMVPKHLLWRSYHPPLGAGSGGIVPEIVVYRLEIIRGTSKWAISTLQTSDLGRIQPLDPRFS